MHSYGSGLYYGDSSGTITTELTKIVMFNYRRPGKVIDNSHLKSVNAQRTAEPGMWQVPEITLTARFDKTNFNVLHTTMIDSLGKAAVKYWKAVDADGSTCIGQAFISSIEKKTPDDDEVDVDLTLTAAGSFTFTPAP